MIYNEAGQLCLTWKGKTKTIEEWVEDADCAVDDAKTLRNRVVRLKWDTEKCLTTPLRVTKPRYVTIGGVTKRIPEWFADEQCRVDRIETLYRRLDDGIDPFTALTTPSGQLWGMAITAWDETKMPGQWQEDCRCRVNGRTIVKRIEAGLTPEQAIRNPSPKPMDRPQEEWFAREIQAQQMLGELKGTIPLADLDLAAKKAGLGESDVVFSNRHPDGEGSFCLGIWAAQRAVPRLAFATGQVGNSVDMWRMWKTNPEPRRMHEGYLYLFRHWFATGEDGHILFL